MQVESISNASHYMYMNNWIEKLAKKQTKILLFKLEGGIRSKGDKLQ